MERSVSQIPGISGFPKPQTDARVPPLREELLLHEGPRAQDGAPTWILEDPARDRFFQIGALEGEMLMRWSEGTCAGIARRVSAETLYRIDAEAVERFSKFLLRMSLTAEPGASKRFLEESRRPKISFWQFLLHHYLFFRIPLFRPDAFLTRTLPLVRKLFLNRIFPAASAAAAVIALYLTSRQWDAFVHTFQHFFSWEGALLAAMTLVFTKIVHELGHAYTTKAFGCRIPSMGVAFMVMMPLLYTDTTSAWRLRRKRERLMVCAAGVSAELALGAWAALAWSFLPDGALRSAAFMLATTTWVMSLAVNMSPFMRFDGYYFLSDLLGVANLQPRAFALAKHKIRSTLFGFADPKPEELPAWLERVLVLYAVGTWIYRFTLFLGIALLVYHALFKVLGIFLFCVEVSVFLVLPIMKELKVWLDGIIQGKATARAWVLPAVLLAAAGALFWPWQTEVSAPAVIRPAEAASIYAPESAVIKRIGAQNGAGVRKGDLLYELDSPETRRELEKLRADKALLDWRISFLRLSRDMSAEVPVAVREKGMLERRIREMAEKLASLQVRAPFDGTFTDALERLQAGEWVSEGEWLGVVSGPCCSAPRELLAVGFINEADLGRIREGAEALFVPEDPFGESIPMRLEAIDAAGAKHLTDYPELASVYGGGIAAVRAGGAAAAASGVDAAEAIVPESAVYRVVLRSAEAAADQPFPQMLRGTVLIQGKPGSPIGRLADYAAAVLIRETGF